MDVASHAASPLIFRQAVNFGNTDDHSAPAHTPSTHDSCNCQWPGQEPPFQFRLQTQSTHRLAGRYRLNHFLAHIALSQSTVQCSNQPQLLPTFWRSPHFAFTLGASYVGLFAFHTASDRVLHISCHFAFILWFRMVEAVSDSVIHHSSPAIVADTS